MTDTEKYAAIVRALWHKTQAKELDWNEDPWEETPSAVLPGENKVKLSTFEYEDEPMELIVLENGQGKEAGRFTDDSIKDVEVDIPGFLNWFDLLRSLRQKALHQAQKVDHVIDDIASSLGINVV